jgi:hypothetical protein
MADRRTASAAVAFREKEFVLGMLRQSTTWGRENRVESGAGPNQPRRGFVSVKAGLFEELCCEDLVPRRPSTAFPLGSTTCVQLNFGMSWMKSIAAREVCLPQMWHGSGTMV